MIKDYYKYLVDYFKVEVKGVYITRNGRRGWFYRATFIETDIVITTQTKLKKVWPYVWRQQRDAINQSLSLGEQMVLF
jgi:hypothetical protein